MLAAGPASISETGTAIYSISRRDDVRHALPHTQSIECRGFYPVPFSPCTVAARGDASTRFASPASPTPLASCCWCCRCRLPPWFRRRSGWGRRGPTRQLLLSFVGYWTPPASARPATPRHATLSSNAPLCHCLQPRALPLEGKIPTGNANGGLVLFLPYQPARSARPAPAGADGSRSPCARDAGRCRKSEPHSKSGRDVTAVHCQVAAGLQGSQGSARILLPRALRLVRRI